MLIVPFIIGIIFLILVISSPFIFKLIFKIENFFGYCAGICCSVITGISLVVLILISIIVLSIIISNNVENGGIEKLINSLNDINNLKDIPFIFLFIIWAILAVILLVIFLVLYFRAKKVSNPQDKSESIFMFFSGYILIPYIFWYIFCIALSFEIKIFSQTGESLTSGLILLWEFGGFFFILLLAGSSIMIMLHHKKFNNLIIWCCVGSYFGPLIFDFLGFITLKGFFFSYLNIIFPLISLSMACFLYHKYASNQGSSEGEYNNVEMAD